MSIQNPATPSRRWPYWLAGFCVCVLVLLGLIAAFGPGIAKNQIIKHGSAWLKRPLAIESLSLNPFTLEVELKGVTVGTLDGQREQLGLDRLWVNVDIGHIGRQEFSANVEANAFRWQDNAGKTLLAAQALKLPVVSGLKANQHAVGVVELNGATVNAERSAKGEINLLTQLDALLASLPQSAEPEPAPAPSQPVQWSVEKILLTDAKLQFVDAQTPGHTPATQNIALQSLSLSGLNQTLADPLPLSLVAKINETGQLKTDGTLNLKPFAANLKVDLNSLPLKPVQPYIDGALNLTLKEGVVDTQSEIHLALPPEKPMQLGFEGHVALRDFAASDPLLKEPFLNWKTLAVRDIDVSLGQKNEAIRLGKIQFDDFFARLIVSSAGELNVLKIARQDTPEAPPPKTGSSPKPSAKPAPGPTIKIAEVAFNRGKVLFSDRFVKPNYTAKIEQVNGQIKGLSSLRNELAEMKLSGRYNQVSPVNVNARLNLLADKRFLDLAAKVTSIELTSFNPYAGRYAGYNIEKGKLSLDLSYKLEDQQLKAENRVFLDQLTFGDKVDSPTATSLPVRLAVSLLKNRKGEIDINLPISGSLDDPQFSVGGIILQVLGNLIMKAVTAPFSLMASMFEGGDQLSNIPFLAGSVELTPEALKRLGTLAKALDDRPALHLEVTGRADAEADAAALKAAKTFKRSVGEEELRLLAQRRAQAAQLWLVEKGSIPAERVFLLPAKIGNDDKNELPPMRVDFSLR